ncbi:MAG TPA: hypothetical protein DEA55_04080 [Rhodospirillaceae bacterium]|nr:hypothetical protein [Rhodospirillaceae bacterium]
MIRGGQHVTSGALSLSEKAVLASIFMAGNKGDNQGSKGSIRDDWGAGSGSGGGSSAPKAFFSPDDFDIYVNKITGETYIFHGPDLPHPVERLEYDPESYRVTVVTKDGKNLDLGVKIQWLVRPYFSRARQVFIVKTKNGESVDGIEVPMTVKGEKVEN